MGLSNKKIARLRGNTKAALRQQAKFIDVKSKLPGKTVFSACFLEDLLVSDQVKPNEMHEAGQFYSDCAQSPFVLSEDALARAAADRSRHGIQHLFDDPVDAMSPQHL